MSIPPEDLQSIARILAAGFRDRSSPPPGPPIMTLKQAAVYLQVSKAHLSNVINGRVPGVPPVRCVRIGRRILIKVEWLDAWMESADLRADQ